MGASYLIDTNAASDFLGAKLPEKGMRFMTEIIGLGPNLSVMSRIELLSFISPYTPLFREFIQYSVVYELTEDIILRTIALRRSRRIKVPDAIIAATALVYDLTLITHNLSDFEGIPGLKLLDPHRL
jgi:predicted nucleic acid-binding protein